MDNVRASWSAISRVANSTGGLEWLATAFRLCEPLKDGDQLSDWLEAVYFNLAMGMLQYGTVVVQYAKAGQLLHDISQFFHIWYNFVLLFHFQWTTLILAAFWSLSRDGQLSSFAFI